MAERRVGLTFQLAEQHRYRLRNLHDGAVLLPLRTRAKPRHKAYRGTDDRFDVITARDGFVHLDGAPRGSFGWAILCRTLRRC